MKALRGVNGDLNLIDEARDENKPGEYSDLESFYAANKVVGDKWLLNVAATSFPGYCRSNVLNQI